jgi:hypothetical protein
MPSAASISRHDVGDRIQHAAECRMLIPDPRIVTIEKIRNAGGDEYGERHPAQP